MARNVVVVSRHHPDLYVYLRVQFAADADTAVILDRRLAERRRERVPTDIDRRRRDPFAAVRTEVRRLQPVDHQDRRAHPSPSRCLVLVRLFPIIGSGAAG